MMNGCGKSDRPIVPRKPANKSVDASMAAERVEGRGLATGNSAQPNSDRAQDRVELHSALDRIRRGAREDKGWRFTTLWHHVYNIRRLRESFLTMRKQAAAGVDGVTWDQYAERLEENLRDLSARLKRGAYRAKPFRGQYIAKVRGGLRPLGIPALEDKLVQRVTAEVMSAVYEEDRAERQ